MQYSLMSNSQIIENIAQNIEKIRIHKPVSAQDLASKGGCNAQTYSNFVNKNTNIKLETIIEIFRGLGELGRLEKAFEFKEPFSPIKYAEMLEKNRPPKRVHKKKQPKKEFTWADE